MALFRSRRGGYRRYAADLLCVLIAMVSENYASETIARTIEASSGRLITSRMNVRSIFS